jgi:riboflavin synthase
MFTGIIEALGEVTRLEREGSNVHFTIRSSISSELQIDQSVAHNGVCLTVVQTDTDTHTVTAIEETMLRSNLGTLQAGQNINLERAMRHNGRLDGHLVQGHVDTTGICKAVDVRDGSWYFFFEYEPKPDYLLVDKGSICVNGVSLTVVNPHINSFAVAIIPYTFQHTTFQTLTPGDRVNLEFDIIGKYIARHLEYYRK